MTSKMTFGVVLRPQHFTWAEQLSEYPKVEAMGFDSIWTNDHLHSLIGPIDNQAFESQTTLAAIAMSTKRVRFGAMTYSVTHRIPTILAKQLVTLDHMSGGRAVLGIGAGWYEDEHKAFAVPFPPAGERVSMLAEALEIFRLLEQNERTNYDGNHYKLVDTPFAPKPVNGHVPVLIGGTKPRMLKLVGQHADIWDSSLKPDEYAVALETIRGHARSAGRDPDAILPSTGVWGPSSAWSGPPDDSKFADTVRAAYKAGARQLLFKYTPDREGIETIPHLMETVVPDLRAELER